MSKANTTIDQTVAQMQIKQRQKVTWEEGDYAVFASYMEAGAIEVLADWNIPSGTRVLDVACGAGQTAIPAAKHGCQVTGVDIAENLIAHARHRARKSRLDIQFDVGDAEKLPYKNHQFDRVMSMFGAMFAPSPKLVTYELGRVLKPGGSLHMANWTSGSMPAQMFKAISEVAPPPPGFISPVLWGDEATIRQRLSDSFTNILLKRKIYPQWQFPFDTNELVLFFRRYFGPVKRAFDVINKAGQENLHDTLANIYRRNSEMRNGILTITNGEYLEVVATRR
jgi:SAM-dependent methyltransferase